MTIKDGRFDFHERGPAWYLPAQVCLLLVLAFSLSSCQTITRFSCNQKNWTNAGQKDGEAGKVAESTFQAQYDKCSAAGSEIDKVAYMNGYQSGLGSFCTLANGIEQASQGFENNNVCQAAMGPDFNNGFEQGLAILCNASGGQQFGISGGIYRGSCPADTEQEFLTSYLNAIDIALPRSVEDIEILEDKKDSLESQIDLLETLVSIQDKEMKSEDAAGSKVYKDLVREQRNEYKSDLSARRRENRQTEKDLDEAEEMRETMEEMLLQWQSKLGA